MGQIATLKKTDKLLSSNCLNAKKSYGQNFIINSTVVEDIVKKSQISKEAVVIEIGAGVGALTEELVQVAEHVIAYEIDEDLVTLLKRELKQPNLEIIMQDFLKVDLKKVLEPYANRPLFIIANLPYYITNEILTKLFISDIIITKIVVMMQKEVGLKLVKPKANKDKNILTMLSSFCSTARVIKYVSKNDFLPRPKVDSIVIEFIPHEKQIGTKDFVKILKILFSSRRKTVLNNLAEYLENKDLAISILNKCKINPNYRAERLSQEEIIAIALTMKEYDV